MSDSNLPSAKPNVKLTTATMALWPAVAFAEAMDAGRIAHNSGASKSDIATEAVKGGLSVIPVLDVLVAPNKNEQNLRRNLALVVGGATIVAVVVGAGIPTAIAAAAGYLVCEDIARNFARNVEMKKDVSPSYSETLVAGLGIPDLVADIKSKLAVKDVPDVPSDTANTAVGKAKIKEIAANPSR